MYEEPFGLARGKGKRVAKGWPNEYRLSRIISEEASACKQMISS
jgi:hypothetical protein